MKFPRLLVAGAGLVAATGLDAQQTSRTEPVTGLRDNGTGFHALVGARVVTAPGQVLPSATIVVRDGLNPAPPLEIRGSNPVLLKACRRIDKMVPARMLEGYERRWREYVERKVGDRYAKSNAITSGLISIDLRQFEYT